MNLKYKLFITIIFLMMDASLKNRVNSYSLHKSKPEIPDVEEVTVENNIFVPNGAHVLNICLPYITRPDQVSFCHNGNYTNSDGCCGVELCGLRYPFCADCYGGCIKKRQP